MSTKQPRSALLSLQDRVARIYYSHGLFCSTHPVPVITFALSIIFICCYPFINLPIHGNLPQEHVTPFKTYSLPPDVVDSLLIISQNRDSIKLDGALQPRWYHGSPVGYIQQILVRASVSPWTNDLIFADAFKAPLSKAFDIVEIVQNYEYADGNISLALDNFCLHVSEATMKQVKEQLPAYGCLIVSPANIWGLDMQKFLSDKDLIQSAMSLGRKETDLSSSLSDILFGVPRKETAIKKLFAQNRQRVVSFAITLILNKYDAGFIQGLEERLHRSFSYLHDNETVAAGNITHIHFHNQYSFVEFIPLIVTYVILFLYIYFSVRKIEMVKSKIGMAFSAVVTVVASLCMSVGLCTWFGLSFTIKAGQVYLKDIFPYLVVIIGLENILVLTKSVVSTPANLDVKVRLAQGLSKEGWSITKNLVTELSILTFGFFTFVPAIQEFCFFAVVGLLSDFFLQLVFFATILAVDIGRMEMSDLQRQCLHQNLQPSQDELAHMYPLFRWPLITRWQRQEYNSRESSSDTSPIVASSSENVTYPANIVAPPYSTANKSPPVKVPKRLRLVYFLARCRIFQKILMLSFIIWVGLIVYKSGVVDIFTVENSTSSVMENLPSINMSSLFSIPSIENSTFTYVSSTEKNVPEAAAILPSLSSNVSERDLGHSLRHKDYDLWRHLLHDHWPKLFGFYNISLNGRYISILPPIKLSIPVHPNEAVHMRQSFDVETTAKFTWSSVNGDESIEEIDDDDEQVEEGLRRFNHNSLPYYPSSPAEVVLAAILAIPSVVFLVYVMVVLYQCICSRNYAEWRSSWSKDSSQTEGDIFTQLVIEAMPVVLEGHPHEVECLATYGNLVVSSCLGGEIRVWDSTSGECLNVLDRRSKSVTRQKSRSLKEEDLEGNEDFPSDYESGSPPSCSESYIDHHSKKQLTPTYSGHFADFDERPHSYPSTSKTPNNSSHQNFLPYNHSSEDLYSCASCYDTAVKPRKRDIFKFQPDLSATIKTDFSGFSKDFDKSKSKSTRTIGETDEGFDFGRFQIYYDEHKQLLAEEQVDEFMQKRGSKTNGDMSPGASHSPKSVISVGQTKSLEPEMLNTACSSIWSLDCKENLIVVGCSDGKIEFWNTSPGPIKYIYDDGTCQGVTGIRICGGRIVAVRLNGAVDFLEMMSPQHTQSLHPSLTSMHRRIHNHSDVESSHEQDDEFILSESISCRKLHTARAHQQPITVLEVEGGRAVTGSQDHTLKVFRVGDTLCLSTLHGHYGPITTLFIDKFSPMTAASGSQDGAVCLWDLQTGTCVCRLRGHDGSVTALSYTASYVLSAGTDNKLLVWERFQGHLLNTINLQQSYCSNIIMLTDNLLLTGQQGSLGVWDIRLGDPVRIVRLGNSDDSVLVRQIRDVGHTIVCDYGSQLRVVRFPAIVEKID